MYWEELGILVRNPLQMCRSTHLPWGTRTSGNPLPSPSPAPNIRVPPPPFPPRGTQALGNIDRRGGRGKGGHGTARGKTGWEQPSPPPAAPQHIPTLLFSQNSQDCIPTSPANGVFSQVLFWEGKHSFGGCNNPGFPDLRRFEDYVSDGARPLR